MGADGCHGEGIFLQFSRINHSCIPNVQNSYNATIRKETVHAVRNIKAGEELSSCYVPPLRSRQQRQEALEQWSFECHCDACDGEAAILHERRRRALFQLDQALAIYESGSILRAATLQFQVPMNHRQALAAAEEMVMLLKEEGLFGIDLAHAYRECSKYSVKEGQMAKAMAYAKKELEIEVACVGEDAEHLGELGARFWINSLETMSEAEKLKARMNEKRNAKEQRKSDRKAAKKAGKGRR
ncbi:hypothetical protein AC578_285 [Pseudocercospora eumusae]|uniref:SET domain-containing protein n=1 Tax=Pseudocercospora eumusae TaxID=321146 RepID=A0A139H6Z6_9PEZI|nr:hypothetical protein AC578_285 [Pseudocercospora eumusae]